MELSYIYFPLVKFFWKPISGKIMILTSYLIGLYVKKNYKSFLLSILQLNLCLVSKYTFKGPNFGQIYFPSFLNRRNSSKLKLKSE
jgi:hypothetical protein